MSKERPWVGIGKMLKAAVITHLMREKSVDRNVKLLKDEDVEEFWDERGEQFAREMNNRVVRRITANIPGPGDKGGKVN